MYDILRQDDRQINAFKFHSSKLNFDLSQMEGFCLLIVFNARYIYYCETRA